MPEYNREEQKIKDFPREPQYGHSIYRCNECGTERIYGFGRFDNHQAMLKCQGTCRVLKTHLVTAKHTWHTYVSCYMGRPSGAIPN